MVIGTIGASGFIRRGDMFYVHSGSDVVIGNEQSSGRPAIIISNDLNNAYSGTVEVVFLTTRPKKELPTHCTVNSSKYISTALCEQIHTVSKERLGSYVGRLTESEMRDVDKCLLVSIGLENPRTPEQIDFIIEELQSIKSKM